MSNTKANIRSKILAQRESLDSLTVAAASRTIVTLVESYGPFRNAREVLLYMPAKNEVDIRPLFDILWKRKVRTLLPRCKEQPGDMDIACLSCFDELVPGPMGLLEPDADRCASLEDAQPDLVIVPGVAFDRRGRRLGFGGGYYDRLLATPPFSSAHRLAPAYAWQIVKEIPTDKWDLPMQAIITETEIIRTGA